MDANDFRRRIDQCWNLVEDDLKIVRTVSSLHSLPVSKEFNRVCLDHSSTYSEIYLAAVSLSQYNFMLNDYSVFQFSWIARDSWRLAYLPNPWLSGAVDAQMRVAEWEELEALGGLGDEDVTSLIGELPYIGSIPAIRFELAPAQYREVVHPAAHLHIGRHTDNRWSLSRPLDPLTFCMTVLRLYYPEDWNPRSSFHTGVPEGCIERRFIDELGKQHLVHQFTEVERRSLHFTSQ